MAYTIYADLDTLVAGAAELIADLAERAIADRGRFTIALAGGGTPKQSPQAAPKRTAQGTTSTGGAK